MKIFLLGPMGSGKSKIGRIFSKKLSISLFDIDKEIEKDLKMSITEIFASKGEIFFRAIETDYLIKTAELKDCVVSTGGGVVEEIKNLKFLVLNINSKIQKILLKDPFYKLVILNSPLRPFMKKDLIVTKEYQSWNFHQIQCLMKKLLIK